MEAHKMALLKIKEVYVDGDDDNGGDASKNDKDALSYVSYC